MSATAIVTPDPRAPAPGFLDPAHANLARELAQNLRSDTDILLEYGFTGPSDPQWIILARSPAFARAMVEAQKEWNAADSTPKRIRYKAQASIELMLPEMHRIAMDPNTPMSTRAEAWRFLKSCSGLDAPKGSNGGLGADGESAGGVNVTINIGDQKVTATLAPRVINGEAEDA